MPWNKIAIMGIVLTALIGGIALYYLQEYAYYTEVQSTPTEVQLTNVVTGEAEPILFDSFKGLDSNSSPIR